MKLVELLNYLLDSFWIVNGFDVWRKQPNYCNCHRSWRSLDWSIWIPLEVSKPSKNVWLTEVGKHIDQSLASPRSKFKPVTDFEERVDRKLFRPLGEVLEWFWFNGISTEVTPVDRNSSKTSTEVWSPIWIWNSLDRSWSSSDWSYRPKFEFLILHIQIKT